MRKRSPRQALLFSYLERYLSDNHLAHLCATLHNDDLARRVLGLYAVKHEETARGRGVGKDGRKTRGNRYHPTAISGITHPLCAVPSDRYNGTPLSAISVFKMVNGLQTLHLKQSGRIYVLQLVGIRLKLTRRLFLISAVCYNNLNISQIRLFTM